MLIAITYVRMHDLCMHVGAFGYLLLISWILFINTNANI